MITQFSAANEKKCEQTTHQFYPIHVRVSLHKLVDIPVLHPLRHHHKPIVGHCHTQQRQYVQVTNPLPSHNLFAEPLFRRQRIRGIRTKPATYPSNLLKVVFGGYPQNIDGNLPATVNTFPYVGKFTIAQWLPFRVVTERKHQ